MIAKLKKRMNQSYLSKIYIYFFGILCVPIITIILINIKSQNIIEKNVMQSNQKVMSWAFDVIDQTVMEMKNNCLTLGVQNALKQYSANQSAGENVGYQRYKIAELLKNYLNDNYHDIFVYFPQDDYIVSSRNSSMISTTYYKTYYSDTTKKILKL